MQKLLFVCNDFIGNTMSGPGIRYWEMARALEQKGHQTAIVSRYLEKDFSRSGITFIGKASFTNLVTWIRRSDCIIQPGSPLAVILSILSGKKLIFDLYDPVIFEFLERTPLTLCRRVRKKVMLFLWKIRQRMILRFGDEFLVATEKQGAFLLGQLTLLGYTKKLNAVIVLPFGLPDAQPIKKQNVLRGNKIKETDFLLVWGGGIWDWFDPFILLEALSKVKEQRTDIKVYFPGLRPPSPDSLKLAVIDSFMDELRKRDLLDSTVYINSEWTSYDSRADYLLEADAGISLHRDSLETRFAFRTRILDYLWAGLPVIASRGDSWSDLIEKKELGITVRPGDADAVADAIIRMADDKAYRTRCREHAVEAATEYRWNELVNRLKLL
jgi:glycosyltransferase involved in cell wall biosynthesis